MLFGDTSQSFTMTFLQKLQQKKLNLSFYMTPNFDIMKFRKFDFKI